MPTAGSGRPARAFAPLALAVLLLALQPAAPPAGARPAGGAPPADTPQARKPAPFYRDGMKGVDLSGLSDAQRDLALKILNESRCTCGCRMTVAQCRVEDQNCPRSPALARAIIDAVRRGATEDEVRAAYAQAAGERSPASAAARRFSFDLDRAPSRGDAAAPVTIVEFSDFLSSGCRVSQQALRQVLASHPGKVRLVFKLLPAPGQPDALLAAKAAEAAGQLGKFWEMHDLLFSGPAGVDAAALASDAKRVGLDAARFQTAMASPETQAAVDRDVAEAESAGVESAPAFFVNGERLRTARFVVMDAAVRRALSPSVPPG